jgi:hypothetical protein
MIEDIPYKFSGCIDLTKFYYLILVENFIAGFLCRTSHPTFGIPASQFCNATNIISPNIKLGYRIPIHWIATLSTRVKFNKAIISFIKSSAGLLFKSRVNLIKSYFHHSLYICSTSNLCMYIKMNTISIYCRSKCNIKYKGRILTVLFFYEVEVNIYCKLLILAMCFTTLIKICILGKSKQNEIQYFQKIKFCFDGINGQKGMIVERRTVMLN